MASVQLNRRLAKVFALLQQSGYVSANALAQAAHCSKRDAVAYLRTVRGLHVVPKARDHKVSPQVPIEQWRETPVALSPDLPPIPVQDPPLEQEERAAPAPGRRKLRPGKRTCLHCSRLFESPDVPTCTLCWACHSQDRLENLPPVGFLQYAQAELVRHDAAIAQAEDHVARLQATIAPLLAQRQAVALYLEVCRDARHQLQEYLGLKEEAEASAPVAQRS